MNEKLRRQPTSLEREQEKEPPCPYDPLKVTTCSFWREPNKEDCRKCLLRSVITTLKVNQTSEAMRWFIGFVNFLEAEE